MIWHFPAFLSSLLSFVDFPSGKSEGRTLTRSAFFYAFPSAPRPGIKKGAARTAPSEGYASNQEVLGRQHNRPRQCCVVGAVHKLPKKRTVLRAALLDALPVFLLVCPRWVSSATGVRDWVDPAHLTCDFHLSFLSIKKGRSHPAPVRRIVPSPDKQETRSHCLQDSYAPVVTST